MNGAGAIAALLIGGGMGIGIGFVIAAYRTGAHLDCVLGGCTWRRMRYHTDRHHRCVRCDRVVLR